MDKLIEQIKEKEIEKLNNQINDIQKQIDELNDKKAHTEYPNRKFSLAYKIFHHKKYLKEDKELTDKYMEIHHNYNLMNTEIENLEHEIERISEKMKDPLANINLKDEKVLLSMCKENNIQIKFDSAKEALENMPNYFGSNLEFMKKAIKEDAKNVCFDKTGDLELFKEVLKYYAGVASTFDRTFEMNEYNSLLESMNKELSPTQIKACGYLFERFKYDLSRMEDTRFHVPALSTLKNSNNILDDYVELLNTDFAKKMEEIYLSGKCIIGLHGTSAVFEGGVNPFFTDGLKNSTQSDAIRDLSRTVAYNIPFLDIIDYSAMKYGGQSNLIAAKNCYIVLLPKDLKNQPIWGSDSEKSVDNYVLPEYVFGYYVKDQGTNTVLVSNLEQNKKHYQFLFGDKCNEPLPSEEKGISM